MTPSIEPVQRLDKHFRELTRKSFERYGFAYADLIVMWPAVIGEEWGALSAPVRIHWPRSAGPADERRKRGGTLTLRVAEGRGLDFQHLAPRIIERINGYYGYEAVTQLKIVQGPIERRPAEAARGPADNAPDDAWSGRLAAIGHERLKQALVRLGAEVRRAAVSRASASSTQVQS